MINVYLSKLQQNCLREIVWQLQQFTLRCYDFFYLYQFEQLYYWYQPKHILL